MKYSPHDLLPCKHPKEEEFKDNKSFFYDNVISHLIPDIIRMANNGIPIDLSKVEELENTVDNVLDSVKIRLHNNPLIRQFLEEKYKNYINKKKKEFEIKLKTTEDYLVAYDSTNITHRTAVINFYLQSTNQEEHIKDKWTLKELKQLLTTLSSNFLEALLANNVSQTNTYVLGGMQQLATIKTELFNKKYADKLKYLESNFEVEFNPNSTLDKQEFFIGLGLETEEVSKKTGNPVLNRKQLELYLNNINELLESKEND